MFSLKRTNKTGAGDSGQMSQAFSWKKSDSGGLEMEVVGEEPTVGHQMRVGSYLARSYQMQDWWQTSNVKRIISDEIEDDPFVKDKKNRVVTFETESGSTYEWRHHL